MGRWNIRIGRAWVGPALIAGLVVVVVSAGAVAAIETGTVSSYWVGLWWSISLITTVGFIGGTPSTVGGALLSVLLMLAGFVLLAMVSAALASLFVREGEIPVEARQASADDEILAALRNVQAQLAQVEARLAEATRGRDGAPAGPPPD